MSWGEPLVSTDLPSGPMMCWLREEFWGCSAEPKRGAEVNFPGRRGSQRIRDKILKIPDME